MLSNKRAVADANRMGIKLRRIFRMPSPTGSKVAICLLTASIAVLDFATPADTNEGIFYFICIVWLISTRSIRWLWGFTAVFVLLTFGALAFGKAPVGEALTWVDLLNRTLTCSAFIVAAIPVHLRLRDLSALERAMTERDRAQQALQESHNCLEARVHERTRELEAEVAERTRTAAKLRKSEQSARQLSVDLIKAQDEERRRIARELHDSVGQNLTHAKMSLDARLRKGETTERGMEWLSQIVDILDKSLAETRTISYLLHPPLLDELGFASAARAFAEGFSSRTGIHVNLDIPTDLPRLQPSLELVLFRVLQESLTNVMRHAGGATVDIRVAMEGVHITLTVRDYGKGMPPELVERLNTSGLGGGVGLSGMRERVLESHGAFEVRCENQGTTIRATIPVTSTGEESRANSSRLRLALFRSRAASQGSAE